MDWEYFIDNDLLNSLVRGGVIFSLYSFWRKNIVNLI
jgi:hypothetical protein